MKKEVLVSTMNLKNENDFFSLTKKMNINDCVIINQCPNFSELQKDITDSNKKLYSYCDKGLSKSRNIAINKSCSEVCVIADDDLVYKNDYEKIIDAAYKKYPSADIIAFYVNSLNDERPTTKHKEGKVGFLKSFKISSFQISFKKKSIIDNNVRFDENFGAGSGKYTCGEENIFLFDCLKKGLKIYYIPIEIATVSHEESTWFKGFNENIFTTLGAAYYRMSKLFCNFFIIQYAIRKHKIYCKEVSFFKALKYMFKGKKKEKFELKKVR